MNFIFTVKLMIIIVANVKSRETQDSSTVTNHNITTSLKSRNLSQTAVNDIIKMSRILDKSEVYNTELPF